MIVSRPAGRKTAAHSTGTCDRSARGGFSSDPDSESRKRRQRTRPLGGFGADPGDGDTAEDAIVKAATARDARADTNKNASSPKESGVLFDRDTKRGIA